MRTKPLGFFAGVIAMLLLLLGLPAAGTSASQSGANPSLSAFTVDDLVDVVNVSIADLSSDGRWLAVTAASQRDRIGIDNYRFGDPTYIAPLLAEVLLIDTQSGAAQKIFPEKRQVRGLKWSPDGNRLAMLLLANGRYVPRIWDRMTNRLSDVALPPAKYLAENTELEWTSDGAGLLMTLRSEDWTKKARDRFEQLTRATVVVLSSKEPFLAWEDLRRMAAVRSVALYDTRSGRLRELLAEKKLNSISLSEDGTFVNFQEDITRKTDYDVIGGTENQVQILALAGGEPRTALKTTKGISNLIWSRNGRYYSYSKEGKIFAASIADQEPRQLTGKKEEVGDKAKVAAAADKPGDDAGKDAEKEKADKEKEAKERFTPVRLSPAGDWLIASNKEGLWLIDTASANREMFLKVPDPEEDRQAPRYQVMEWSPDGQNIYLTYASRTQWERGLLRYNCGTKQLTELVKDAHQYSAFRLSKDGRTLVFSRAEGNRPPEVFTADAEFEKVRPLTDANPRLKGKRLGRTELVSYLDADGEKMYGVVYYPAEYEAGRKYPTVFLIYEQFFDDTFSGTIGVLNTAGYAVMQPSVKFETGFPGEAWAKGVTAAANKLVEMGLGDPERLGVQGTSYGGYATNLLITQTHRFKAAINVSGKVNMVSFYTDSPRLGVRNIHAPEKSQDRIGATLWQQPQKYLQHSAILFADRIKTPLLLITGEQDANVPPRQAMEMYYALRRLGKEVEWVSYTHGGHGMPTSTVEEVKDYHQRILRWYDDHLKGDLKKKPEDKE